MKNTVPQIGASILQMELGAQVVLSGGQRRGPADWRPHALRRPLAWYVQVKAGLAPQKVGSSCCTFLHNGDKILRIFDMFSLTWLFTTCSSMRLIKHFELMINFEKSDKQ